jgi:hypothetical protein
VSKYIIAERWQAVLSPTTVVAAGVNLSPTAVYTANYLDASAECKLQTPSATVPNTFQEPDTLLIKRARLWSPLLSLGLGGAGTGATGNPLQIIATRRTTTDQGQLIQFAGALNLGEWIDVNQTLSNAGLPAGTGWALGINFPDAISLDASRINPALIGVALLSFSVQVEIAHTLPGSTV